MENLLTPQQVSERLQVPVATLSVWRHRSLGPSYFKVGRHVRYREGDLDSWLDAQKINEN